MIFNRASLCLALISLGNTVVVNSEEADPVQSSDHSKQKNFISNNQNLKDDRHLSKPEIHVFSSFEEPDKESWDADEEGSSEILPNSGNLGVNLSLNPFISQKLSYAKSGRENLHAGKGSAENSKGSQHRHDHHVGWTWTKSDQVEYLKDKDNEDDDVLSYRWVEGQEKENKQNNDVENNKSNNDNRRKGDTQEAKHQNGAPYKDYEKSLSNSNHHFWDNHDEREDFWRVPGKPRRHRRAKEEGSCELEIKCRGDQDVKRPGNGIGGVTGVKLPIRGQRGTAGEKGEKGEPGRPGIGYAAKESISLKSGPDIKVAFFVGLSKNLGPLSKNSDVIFDRVVTNVGDAFDEKTGQFVAPVDGTYQFNVVISAQGKQKDDVKLLLTPGKASKFKNLTHSRHVGNLFRNMLDETLLPTVNATTAAVMVLHNGRMMSTVWAESIPSWSTSSSTLVLSLKAQDKIGLLALQKESYLHGYMYTTFSGYLIFQD